MSVRLNVFPDKEIYVCGVSAVLCDMTNVGLDQSDRIRFLPTMCSSGVLLNWVASLKLKECLSQ